MYKKILVPVLLNDSERAGAAVAVARKLLSPSGEITLLNVVEEIPMYVEAYIPQETIETNIDQNRTELEAEAASQGSDVKAKVISGHAGRTILDEAGKMGADCIVISSHRPGLADYFLGSTAGRVVRHATCPVLVLR